jgi:preprotein translocase subunit SecG
MIIFVTIVHVLVCIGLILVVLLQTGKGAEVGAVFGGSSATIFGSSGAGNFLSRLTTGMAIVFLITSLTLGYFAGRKPSETIFDNRPSPTAPSGTGGAKQESTPVPSEPSPAQPTAPEAAPPEKAPTP